MPWITALSASTNCRGGEIRSDTHRILEHVLADNAGANSSSVNSTVMRLHEVSWDPVQNIRNFRRSEILVKHACMCTVAIWQPTDHECHIM